MSWDTMYIGFEWGLILFSKFNELKLMIVQCLNLNKVKWIT